MKCKFWQNVATVFICLFPLVDFLLSVVFFFLYLFSFQTWDIRHKTVCFRSRYGTHCGGRAHQRVNFRHECLLQRCFPLIINTDWSAFWVLNGLVVLLKTSFFSTPSLIYNVVTVLVSIHNVYCPPCKWFWIVIYPKYPLRPFSSCSSFPSGQPCPNWRML